MQTKLLFYLAKLLYTLNKVLEILLATMSEYNKLNKYYQYIIWKIFNYYILNNSYYIDDILEFLLCKIC